MGRWNKNPSPLLLLIVSERLELGRDDDARDKDSGARGEDRSLVRGHSGMIHSQQRKASDQIHGNAEPIGHGGPMTLGDERASQGANGWEVDPDGEFQSEEGKEGQRLGDEGGSGPGDQGADERGGRKNDRSQVESVLRRFTSLE